MGTSNSPECHGGFVCAVCRSERAIDRMLEVVHLIATIALAMAEYLIFFHLIGLI